LSDTNHILSDDERQELQNRLAADEAARAIIKAERDAAAKIAAVALISEPEWVALRQKINATDVSGTDFQTHFMALDNVMGNIEAAAV
jgi:hypothetical protein